MNPAVIPTAIQEKTLTTQTMYLSKYALSSKEGIKAIEAKSTSTGGYVTCEKNWNFYKVGRDVHATHAEAVVAAEADRVKRIASLKKQIAKLEKLSFSEAA